MKNTLFLLSIIIAFAACTKVTDKPDGSFLSGNGAFILNEGNFTWGNGSLSFYSYDSSKIYNNLFSSINGRPLGDVPNSMIIAGDNAYLLVNNSGKIEVVNKNTLESTATISALVSPRNIAFANNNKAYVTSMYSDSVVILNLSNNTVSGFINLRRSSESIIVTGEKAFISNWVGGDEVFVINTENDEVVDSIKVGHEPESMVIDKNKILWVLCNGGWTRENFAELVGINTLDNTIVRNLVFSTKQASPSCLQIDGKGETIYYLENGVMRMNISDLQLPAQPFISQSANFFYKIGINPVNGDIFITDTADYQHQGYVMVYKNNGILVSTEIADIIPGLICFKLNDNFPAE